jgi:hypothetical protein
MEIVIGPILKRASGYVFDTWIAGKGMSPVHPYRRIEDASYARKATIKASAAVIVCQTLDEFIACAPSGISGAAFATDSR